ncbi:Mov34/MPN/PAD-1 family protein [Streptomyces sp. NPDC058691]|uniref:Mov34/MPN/PAD-1 family protein n=1 Tax=Streptomyces sp. NPDC058691 TaxID=3346601 RepID=UPI0036468415
MRWWRQQRQRFATPSASSSTAPSILLEKCATPFPALIGNELSVTRPAVRIELCPEAYEVITSATADRLPVETGGLLLGYREDANVLVTHALVIDGEGASTHRYVRDDVRANALLAAFLTQRADDDPTGYVGEWHSHPVPSGPSQTDVAAMHATAQTSDGPIALLVYAPGGADPFFGLIVRRQRVGRVSSKKAAVVPPSS